MSDEHENGVSSEAATQLTFNIKSSSDQKHVVTVPDTMTVQELKQKLSTSEFADISPERQRLIYAGRVLKDPDTLASYKIKDGNTVHLVKGAANTARQQPSSQGSPSVPEVPNNSGVPQNIAAGTGNDPLAGLTGARYAGFAQMPGAGMFGPDGGVSIYPSSFVGSEHLRGRAYSRGVEANLSLHRWAHHSHPKTSSACSKTQCSNPR